MRREGIIPQCVVTEFDETRTLDQNARFHAMVDDVARQAEYMGRKLPPESWKVLFVSGHSIATKQGGEVLPGMEGEFVAIRESTARMGKKRASSLIEYLNAWCAQNGIVLQDETA
jgi:hypothetical protein